MSLAAAVNSLAERVGQAVKALALRVLPTGGAIGAVLTKTGTGDFAVGWASPSQSGEKQVFVQSTAPVVADGTPYIWVQSGIGPSGAGFTFWVEDGA